MTESSLVVSEVDQVIEFRRLGLEHAGWSQRNAELIAVATDVDWHLAVELRKECDDEHLLMRILF